MLNCRILIVVSLAQDNGVEDITANSLHPGAIATNLFRHYRLVSGNLFLPVHGAYL